MEPVHHPEFGRAADSLEPPPEPEVPDVPVEPERPRLPTGEPIPY